jgi:protein SCO1/2
MNMSHNINRTWSLYLRLLVCSTVCLFALVFLLAAVSGPVQAQVKDSNLKVRADSTTPQTPDEVIKRVGFDQKLNAQVPLNAVFRDENGQQVRLGQYFGEKPVMMILIQYRCTMLCSHEMNALMKSLKELKFDVGKQFNLLTVSIDPRETPELAAGKKKSYVEDYGRPGASAGWHFLTGKQESIDQLADSIGFHYVYDAKTDQFAHPDGVTILTPEGKASGYFFRLEYPARDLRFGLIEAASHKIGTPLDYLSLLCYHYNPTTGKYSVGVWKVMRLTGLIVVLGGLAWIAGSLLRERRQGRWRMEPEMVAESKA